MTVITSYSIHYTKLYELSYNLISQKIETPIICHGYSFFDDGKLHVQAGAGIVADSDPQSEWEETRNKARAVLRAAELAEQGLNTRMD